MDFTKYSQEHRHVLANELPPLLDQIAQPGVIADLGCGDGPIIWALHEAQKLGDVTYAVDLSPDRVRQAEKIASGVQGIIADATATTLPDASVDGVIVSQVIEHLDDDRLLAPEIARILKPGGWWYVGSVLRGARAWWIYKQDGRRLLDPTHVREYESREEFLAVIAHPDLGVARVFTKPMEFPVTDLVTRALAMTGVVSHNTISRLYADHPRLTGLRKMRVRAPGYSLLEANGFRR